MAESALVVESMSALMQITKGEVDMQVATAKQYPRDVTKFLKDVRSLALLDVETAASLSYALPRAGKLIEGPSVRFAEIIASAWGNLRAETRILDADKTHITAQAMCWDMEKNVAVRTEVKRRITDKRGQRFNDDMIVVTGNAAASIALRNAVFKVVPMAYLKPVMDDAKALVQGNAQSLAEKRTKAVGYFSAFGVPEARVLAVLGRPGMADVDWDDIRVLHGLAQAVKEGSTTVEEAFPEGVNLEKKGKQGFMAQMKPKPKSQPVNTPEIDDSMGANPEELPSDDELEASGYGPKG